MEFKQSSCKLEMHAKKHLSNFEITNGVLIKYNGTEPNVILPNGITRIGSNAFSSCVFLASVTIPNGVIAIGEYAFSHCKFLKNINLPNSVIAIGMHAFFECEILESITIPNTTISLGEGAFDRCSKLTIHCEAPFKPKSWHKDWNISKCHVVWGYKLK